MKMCCDFMAPLHHLQGKKYLSSFKFLNDILMCANGVMKSYSAYK